MHFSHEVLFWECYESVACETFPAGVPDATGVNQYIDTLERTSPLSLKLLVANYRHALSDPRGLREVPTDKTKELPTLDQVHCAWRGYLRSYLTFGITKEDDIFVALQGISQDVVTDVLHDRMIAGLTESRLIQELGWTFNPGSMGTGPNTNNPDTPYKPATWRAPSWSWASTRRPVYIETFFEKQTDYPEPDDLIRIIDTHVETELSGEVTKASLWIECRPFVVGIREVGQVRAKTKRRMWDAYYLPEHVAWTFGGEAMRISMDDPIPTAADHSVRNVYFMLMRHCVNHTGTRISIEGLVIVPSEDGAITQRTMAPYADNVKGSTHSEQHERFRRVGVFDLSSGSFRVSEHLNAATVLEELMEKYRNAESRVIELV
jgi:hypothetical protein